MKIINHDQALEILTSRDNALDVRDMVAEIIARVRSEGDEAICEFSRRFDNVDMGSIPRVMGRDELEAYVDKTKPELTDRQIEAIDTALENVAFTAQRSQPQSWRDTAPTGHTIGEEFIALNRVACYVPQGSFPLVSTAIHTAAIAKASGVSEIVMVTSPSNGELTIAVAYAAFVSGVTEIVFAGGAQGIAAVAYGTETIKRVDFICGPGNSYVAEAKRQVFGDVGIDMVAGPSEVFVIVDETANPYAIACDLIAQAEHGSGSELSVLLTTSKDVADKVGTQLATIKQSITNNPGFDRVYEESLFIVITDSIAQAAQITNVCAPEHVEVITKNRADAELVAVAGAVFIGEYSAEPLGDFVAGPSHVLPTNSSARFSSGLSAASFFRRTSIIDIDKSSYETLAPLAFEFGEMEGLRGHTMSAVARLDETVRPHPVTGGSTSHFGQKDKEQ